MQEATGVDQLVALKDSCLAASRTYKKPEGMPDMELVPFCFYDSKPVCFMSTCCETLEWVRKHHDVYTQKDGNHIVHHLRLNEIDDYNFLMMSVDIMDKGRVAYKPDRFLRQRKYWHALFWFLFFQTITNAHAVCCPPACLPAL